MTSNKYDKDLVEDLKSLHQVLTKNYHCEDDLFQEYLAIGKKLFALETGIVSRIENEEYKILSYSSPLAGLENNQVFPLQDTYCREVFEKMDTVAFPHVGSVQRMCNHPVYVNMKLESYISTPIFVNDEIFGTINFTDRSIRLEGFTSHQLELIEIMAKTIGRFLEAKIYKEKLKSANETISRFVGVVAHDLRNPLGSILSLSELVLEETKENMTREYITLVEEAATYSIDMVDTILGLSAIESGKIQIIKTENSVDSLVKNSWKTVNHLALKKLIKHQVIGEDITFTFDKERMKQVFCNLYTNAIKFSNNESKITTRWECKGDMIVIIVEDEGVGMTPQQMSEIFDVSKSTSTVGTNGETGTGYGLLLVSKIISLHNGEIDVESTEGSGTKFIISLPISNDKSED
ncbi:GAF domain-containing sensor histidine kinase [Bacteriovorax sp. Seq25_V]|uniref:GAF domain-containing sensor histidine kinase n=1 Tax=Bacteriovorax sp. Seq25_V TaxID=1201288 RepID=UPI00038A3078|nr:GAF domain-containing sensor histidine kinase [Bacteriovorax sp. Seq25_V]EQC45477.1 GHKL domain protein [Bacteriovorax sp. Seq25_V]